MTRTLLAALLVLPIGAQAQVRCVPVPNAYAFTVVCNTGYWWSINPDGSVIDGNGVPDHNNAMQGSTIKINPLTGGPTGRVEAPTQEMPTPYGAPKP